MKVMLVNGSPHEKGCIYTALTEVAGALEKNGIETEIFWLGIKPISECIACGHCWGGGGCAIKDRMTEFAEAAQGADGFVFGSPVHFSGVAPQLAACMSRMCYSGMVNLAGKPCASVVSCRRGGNSATFEQINQFFGITGAITVGSQYWNDVHGNSPEEVKQDLEGLQIMRTLGNNMAWIIKCIEAGKQEGIEYPEFEPRVRTNFIEPAGENARG